jgi:quercetin dioxygenase-like cupin family protein
MTENTGWTFTDQATVEWQPLGPGIAMKSLGVAGGKIMAMFKFDAGYEGGVHEHTDEPEFTYILEGAMTSNGVLMEAGHAYAAEPGTTHSEFRTDTGGTVLSVFPVPPGMGG